MSRMTTFTSHNSEGPIKRAKRLLRRFVTAKTGAVAIEFAYLAPVLMLMIGGTIEASRAISMNRKFSLVTSMMADMVAREEDVSTAELDQMMNVIAHVMAPYSASDLRLAVIPVEPDPDDNTKARVYATPYTHNGKSAPGLCAAYDLPSGVLAAGTPLVVIEAEYDFKPLFAGIAGFAKQDSDIISADTWSDRAVNSPRGGTIRYDGVGPNDQC